MSWPLLYRYAILVSFAMNRLLTIQESTLSLYKTIIQSIWSLALRHWGTNTTSYQDLQPCGYIQTDDMNIVKDYLKRTLISAAPATTKGFTSYVKGWSQMPNPINQKVTTSPLTSRATRLLLTSKTESLCVGTEHKSSLGWSTCNCSSIWFKAHIREPRVLTTNPVRGLRSCIGMRPGIERGM